MSDAKEKAEIKAENELIAEVEDDDLMRMSTSEIRREVVDGTKERFMVVSTLARFASTDVFEGISSAMRELGHFTFPYYMDKMKAFLSVDFMLKDIVASAVSVRNGFTHILFVGAVFIPRWVIDSIQRCGVKVLYWSLEDPHALDQNAKFHDWADYYFSNEVNTVKVLPKAFYLPTAGSARVCMPPRVPLHKLPDNERNVFTNDVIFAGNVYPNRQKMLEELDPFMTEKNYIFGIAGITALMEDRENSPLRKRLINFKDSHGEELLEGVVDHNFFVLLYGYAKIVLNFERDSYFEYNEKFSTNRTHKLKGESLNPRAYEIALCGGGLQMIDDKRAELQTGKALVPGEHCVVFKDIPDLKKKIEYYLTHEKERMKIVLQARQHASKNHNYTNRVSRMLMYIRLKEGRKAQVAEQVKGMIQNGQMNLKQPKKIEPKK